MTVASLSGASTPAASTKPASGFAALGQGDFLKLMTVQLQQQDPFSPVDQKEMLAQMAQFSSLAGVSEMGETLKYITWQLDALIAAQQPAAGEAASPDLTSQEN